MLTLLCSVSSMDVVLRTAQTADHGSDLEKNNSAFVQVPEEFI